MYSPKIKEDLIPQLYQEAKKQNKPMTQLVNEILTEYFYDKKENIIIFRDKNNQRKIGKYLSQTNIKFK